VARRLRIQYPGAIYHVINRGNYRRDVFETADKAAAFERCLFETAQRMGWHLYAYALMRNHYHLAIVTPEPNLVEGMHWLQSTFATRFNRFRQERGHLFQGRYQSLLIEPGATLLRVIDYIHLNPVRAGIVPAERVAEFRWGSLRRFVRGDRPSCLHVSNWLTEAGLTDSAEGWSTYQRELQLLSASPARQQELGFDDISRGWAIGTQGWRNALAKKYSHRALAPGLEAQELKELKAANCEAALCELLLGAGRTTTDAAEDLKSAPWKVAIARSLRETTPASNRWIAEKLHMGAPNSVSKYLARGNRGNDGKNPRITA
jgi:putative transposase